MNKPIVFAAVFVAAALAFLIWSWVAYDNARAMADENRINWELTAQQRQQFVDLQRQLKQLDTASPPAGKSDLIALMGELRDKTGIDPSQMEVRGDRVSFTGITIATMGELFNLIRTRYPYLVVREIRMQPTPKAEPGQFNWTLMVRIPEA